jgi:hypothetical protein
MLISLMTLLGDGHRQARDGRSLARAGLRLFWDPPRIHGELLKLAIDCGESSVIKYMKAGARSIEE